MFSHQQISHSRAFGFVVGRGLLSKGEAAQLAGDVASSLRAADGGIGTDADYSHRGYDSDQWPTWQEWVGGARNIPSRNAARRRLRLLGARQ